MEIVGAAYYMKNHCLRGILRKGIFVINLPCRKCSSPNMGKPHRVAFAYIHIYAVKQ